MKRVGFRLNIVEKRYKANQIIKLINDYFSTDCRSFFKTNGTILPRQIAIYFIIENIVLSYEEVGKLFRSRVNDRICHSTISYSRKKIINWLEVNDKEVVKHVKALKKEAEAICKLTGLDLEKYKLRQEILDKITLFDLERLTELNNKIIA